MCQPRQVPQIDRPQGFVLLEVLVAMNLILGSWMTSVGAYQNLALRSTQTESKRVQLQREFDAFEMSEHARARISPNSKGQINESTRVSSRNRTKHLTSQPTLKNQR
jgi:Tfp pilus assembly protein PilV